MREDIHNPPVLSLLCAMKGLLGGGLMSLAAFASWDPVARSVLFIIGIIIFIDSVMPVDRALYAFSSVFFYIIGGLAGFFTAISKNGFPYLVILLVLGVAVYLDKIRRMRELGKIKHEK